MHYPVKFDADIFIQSGVIDIFPIFKMAAAAILDFQIMWIWLVGCVDSVVFVFCTNVTPPTAKRWLSVVRCVRQQSEYFVKGFITNNTENSQRNDDTAAKHTQKYTDT